MEIKKPTISLNAIKMRIKSIFRRDTLFSITVRRIMFFLIILGIFLRIWVFFNFDSGYDAPYYITLGKSISERGDLYLPFGDIETDSLEPTQGTSTRQAYPIYLSISYVLFGFSYTVTKIAATFLSILTIVVVYFTTRNLYGKNNALVVTGIVSLVSTLITTCGVLYSDNLTYLLLAVGVWGLVKGGRLFPIGVVSTSIFFISRSYSLTLYILFIVLLWGWLYYSKRKEVLNKWHIIALLSTIPFMILLYLSRKYSSYPATSISITDALLDDPLYIVGRYLIHLLFICIFTLGFAIFFFRPLKSSFSTKNLLWMLVAALFLGLPLIMAYQDSIYHIYERAPAERLRSFFYITLPLLWLAIPRTKFNLDEKLQTREFWRDPRRSNEYKKNIKLFALIIIFIGLAFIFFHGFSIILTLVIGFVSLFFKEGKWKIALLSIMLVVVSTNDNTGARYEHWRELGEDMNEMLEDGDVIMLDGIDYIKDHNGSSFDRYVLAPYTAKDYRIINFDSNETPDYILTKNHRITYDNYSVLRKYFNTGHKGIFTQLLSEIYKLLRSPPEAERIPEFTLWGRD